MSPRGPAPYHVEAERAVLGAMLLNRQALQDGLVYAGISDADFYVPEHAEIFLGMAALFRESSAVDPLTLKARLDLMFPRRQGQTEWAKKIAEVQAGCPTSFNARSYAKIVANDGAMRRALGFFADLAHEAQASNVDAVMTRLANYEREIAAPPPPVEPSIDLNDLCAMKFEGRFLVPGILRRRDRLMLTGLEGLSGKTELLFQWAVMFASGIHPWTLMPEYTPLRVLYLDCENELEQLQPRAVERLRGAAGENYRDNALAIESRTTGVNLCAHPDQSWLTAKIELHEPDVLIMGPLYNLFRAVPGQAKHSEETAEVFGDAVKSLTTRYDLAVLIEAHSPHGESGDRAGGRPYGASYWLRWPEMGVFLRPRTRWQGRHKVPVPGEYDFSFWRGTRDIDIRRPWPSGVHRAKPWSFACDDEEVF